MIEIGDHLYLGRGRTRECFVDPRDPAKCIKIDFIDRGYRQTAKEAAYYRKLRRLKPALEYDFIPEFFGMEQTDRGPGGVFELIRDDDGNVSRTLGEYLREGMIAADPGPWQMALGKFLDRLLGTGVIVRDLNPSNLCARKLRDGSIRLTAIDGIGHRDFIPLCDYFPALARRKLRRAISRRGMGSVRDLLERHARMALRHAAAASNSP